MIKKIVKKMITIKTAILNKVTGTIKKILRVLHENYIKLKRVYSTRYPNNFRKLSTNLAFQGKRKILDKKDKPK